jgi:hypothetical protein
MKSGVSSQESEWNENLVVVYINTNSEYVLAGISKHHLCFPVFILLNTGICIYHHIQLQRVPVMWDKALQNGLHHIHHAAVMSSAVWQALLQ